MKFINETKEIFEKMDLTQSEINDNLSFYNNDIERSVEKLFTLWKKTKKQYKKMRK